MFFGRLRGFSTDFEARTGVARTDVNLPFITADQSGPKHLNIQMTRLLECRLFNVFHRIFTHFAPKM